VVTVNVADDAPAPTVTDVGTLAEVLLLDSETETPPVPAGPVSVTVPLDETPPARVDGLSVID
jgi:hypothetical protein